MTRTWPITCSMIILNIIGFIYLEQLPPKELKEALLVVGPINLTSSEMWSIILSQPISETVGLLSIEAILLMLVIAFFMAQYMQIETNQKIVTKEDK